jgi:poly(hydroxyalkanoate) depolymerase family esterase
MNRLFTDNMREATRLTRAGRLSEASVLLHRALHGEQPTDAAATTSPHTVGGNAGRPPRIIDVDPATGASPDAVGTATMRPVPDALRDFLGRINQRTATLRPGGRAHFFAGQRADAIPEGAQFIAGSFTGATGSRDYKLYIPSTHTGEPAPLVVMLHGCTQSPDDFAAGTRMNALAEEHACLVVYPAQPSSANAQRCWNWFSPGDQQRDTGEPALIAGITRQVMRDHAIDPRRVYVAGLSAGGAAAAIMAQAYPDLYAAIGVHSGLACGAARDVSSAFAAMRHGASVPPRPDGGKRRIVPTIVFHADQDDTVHPRNGDQVITQSAAGDTLRAEMQTGQVPGGHAYSRTVYTDAAGEALLERWLVHGGGHAWSGGSPDGSYTDPRGPDASREMLRFFLDHAKDGSPVP